MNNKGFTLVELSIAMIIIGLLIGGIIKGQELVINARIKSDIATTKNIEAATLTFYDIYRFLPGDLRNASRFIPGCPLASPCGQVFPNQGNGVVDFPCSGNDFFASEERQFFTHLAAANLLSGVSSAPSAPLEPGKSIPKSSIGDGMMVLFTGTPVNIGGCANGSTLYSFNEPSGVRPFLSSISGQVGHFLLLGVPKGFTFDMDPLGVSPRMVSQLDSTIDDGFPYSGSVQVGNLNGLCAQPFPTNRYRPDQSGGQCETLIKLKNVYSGR